MSTSGFTISSHLFSECWLVAPLQLSFLVSPLAQTSSYATGTRPLMQSVYRPQVPYFKSSVWLNRESNPSHQLSGACSTNYSTLSVRKLSVTYIHFQRFL